MRVTILTCLVVLLLVLAGPVEAKRPRKHNGLPAFQAVLSGFQEAGALAGVINGK